MPWLALVKALLSLANTALTYAQERKLIAAGEAKQIAENLNASLELLGVVNKARADAAAKFDAAGGVPDEHDPNRRD